MKIDFREVERRKDAVDWFGNAMLSKLLENAPKGNWNTISKKAMIELLEGELEELKSALKKGNHLDIIREAADVANYAMMVATKYKQEK